MNFEIEIFFMIFFKVRKSSVVLLFHLQRYFKTLFWSGSDFYKNMFEQNLTNIGKI